MRYFVEIHGTGVISQRHELLEEQAAVGATPDASVRVEMREGAEMPLILLARQAEAITVRLPERVPGTLTFRGEPTRAAAVPWGEDIYAGSVRLAFVAEGGKAGRSGGVIFAIGLLVAAAVGAAWIGSDRFSSPKQTEIEPPSLVVATTPCAEHAPGPAKAFAFQALSRARSKRQRAPFDRAEGVQALELFSQAKACFETAGSPPDAEVAEKEHAELKGQLDEEYAALRLRLRVSLDQKRYADAAAAVQALERLLAPQGPSPYRAWLLDLRQDLERRMRRSGG
ncbi:MAG TPA: hypothetical protein VHB79_19665 [Polyangiaceae bacterium]|nr:hypothetical protein [Polyangiaceae bacterium]